MTLLLFHDLYLGSDVIKLSDRNCDSRVQYVPCYCVLLISCSVCESFFGGLGRTDILLNWFTSIPSLNDMILFEILFTSYGPFHLFLFSLYNLTLSLCRMRYSVACGSLLVKDFLILFYATIVSVSALAFRNAFFLCRSPSLWGWKDFIILNTNSDRASPLGSIISFVVLIDTLSFELSSSCW